MSVVTTPTLPGHYVVKVLSDDTGLTVQAKGVGGKNVAGIEGMFDGEGISFGSMAEMARKELLKQLFE